QTPAPTGDAATNSIGRPTISLVPVDAAAKTRGAAEKTTGAQAPAQKDAAPDKTAPAPMESADGGSCAADDAKWGPSLPQDVKFLQNLVGCDSLRLYGWADAGYTYNSHGHQLMDVEPRENRFGNEMLVHQLAIVLE